MPAELKDPRQPRPQLRLLQGAIVCALLLAAVDLVWVYLGTLLRARDLELLGEPGVVVKAYAVGLWALLVLSLVLAGLLALVVRLASALEASVPGQSAALRLTLGALPYLTALTLWLVPYLQSGRWAREHIGGVGRGLLLGAGLLSAGFATLLIVLRLRQRLSERPVLYRVLLLACFAGLVTVDYLVLPRLYVPLHGLLGLTAALCILELSVAGVPGRWRRDTLMLVSLCVLLLVGLPPLAPWSSRPLANFYVSEFAPFSGKALRLIGQVREWARGSRPTRKRPARPPNRQPAFDLVGGRDLFILSVDGVSPFRSSLPVGLRVTERDTTPFLAEQARRGVFFARHYTVVPDTEATMLTLLSGVEFKLQRRPRYGERAQATLIQRFHRLGYRTYCDIPYAEEMFRLLSAPERCDVTVNYAKAQWNANGLLNFVRDTDAPIFAIVHMVSTHKPYQRFADHRFGEDEEDGYDEALAGTDAVLRRLYGELVALSPEARFVFTSDHGHAFGWHGVSGHRSTLFEDQLRIPLILTDFDLPAARIERVTNVLDLHGLLTGEAEQAKLVQHLREGTQPPPRAQPACASRDSKSAAILGRYKLIRDSTVGSEALFDVARDAREQHNLIAEQPDTAAQLRPYL